MLIGWNFLMNPFIKIIITAINYIFNNLWNKIDVCLVFKKNRDRRMIDLSTQTIFLWWYSQCSVKMDSSTAVSEMWRAIFTAWQIRFPSNATLIQIYLLIFIQVKKRVTVGRCCTSSTKRAALHCTYSHYPLRLRISKNCFFLW